jgi:hypothetical protein
VYFFSSDAMLPDNAAIAVVKQYLSLSSGEHKTCLPQLELPMKVSRLRDNATKTRGLTLQM